MSPNEGIHKVILHCSAFRGFIPFEKGAFIYNEAILYFSVLNLISTFKMGCFIDIQKVFCPTL